MSEQELSKLAAQLKQALNEYVPSQNISAKGSFVPGGDNILLTLHIAIPSGYKQ